MKKGKTAVGIFFVYVILCAATGVMGNSEKEKEEYGDTVPVISPVELMGSGYMDNLFIDYEQHPDPLLVLVNDKVPLPEDWTVIPAMIHDEQVNYIMYRDLCAMFDAAAEEEIWFWVASGYRSVKSQERILEAAVGDNMEKGMDAREAENEALKTIAPPGYSEHHTGLAVDLNDVSDDFKDTPAYEWLSLHAAEYGFVQRYKAEKTYITGIDEESWHYRYVGREHALKMNELDMCLEEYLLYLRDENTG